ncbi:PTS mannitol transporter subunit IICB [Paenibacillus mucilaginosus]|uniref:PTS system mannitol-specific EIICB component n=1 Tax=Paenibacillus mucilaginosus (strain KNP414) TaxID=1036673 RepID=F8FNC2_PAEMK|nr:PTS mannitol transporter subunit IICBA [Paenibacillus mucilaginosus]AEI38959.1 MtlA [Paenibacillus mucilaginosus KNP414]MCG7216580.1 PTS mannitol transporter subunit IICBA [Paenibacillus mucilaginosus]WDM28004.1 PTS mannitol transporter subunit IICBA [Paenibacillus mucilaginosus]
MSTTATQPASAGGGIRVKVQRFGRFLSGMVMPNIGAFIAWGLITALFIPTGWFPNEDLAKLVGPMITYLLPILIGYTGGTMIHGARGGVIGAVTTMGVIIGTDIPMFLGAMIVGPFAAWVLKQFDRTVEGRIRSGFEMLVNNFSAGIIGALLAVIAYLFVGPVVQVFSKALASGVQGLVNAGLLPLANVLIEPAKILFLNNAINHGVLSPIALDQAAKTGQSMLFMLESNPGPGLGILLAYWLVGRGSVKQSAPGAVIIHFFGGIHEIYFPYILMNPRLILAVIAGGITGTFTFGLFHAGLVAPPSPGSIFAFMAMAPKGGLLPVFSGVLTGAAASFAVAALLLKTTKQEEQEESLEQAAARMKEMKGTQPAAAVPAAEAAAASEAAAAPAVSRKAKEDVRKIVFSCDAGMGSSAMGASILRKKLKDAGADVTVINTAISEIPGDADIVITHRSLTDRAKAQAPKAEHISIDNFMKSPEYDELTKRLA